MQAPLEQATVPRPAQGNDDARALARARKPLEDRAAIPSTEPGCSASSADVQIRVYALTREWNEFFAVQEDVLLNVSEIVRKSGTSLALPSQTLYFGGED